MGNRQSSIPDSADEREQTRADIHRAAVTTPPGRQNPLSDLEETVGIMMAQTIKNTTQISEMKIVLGRIDREMAQTRKDLEIDRDDIINKTARRSSRHSSNRSAAIMATVGIAWNIAQPYLVELWYIIRHIHH